MFLVATLLACKLNVHYALLEGELDWVVNRYIHFIRVFCFVFYVYFPPRDRIGNRKHNVACIKSVPVGWDNSREILVKKHSLGEAVGGT